jgi:hypothetical protein
VHVRFTLGWRGIRYVYAGGGAKTILRRVAAGGASLGATLAGTTLTGGGAGAGASLGATLSGSTLTGVGAGAGASLGATLSGGGAGAALHRKYECTQGCNTRVKGRW